MLIGGLHSSKPPITPIIQRSDSIRTCIELIAFPIRFLTNIVFYNATVVEGILKSGGGSLGFADDFNREDRLYMRPEHIQVPVGGASGSSAEEDATGFIHFELRPIKTERRPALRFAWQRDRVAGHRQDLGSRSGSQASDDISCGQSGSSGQQRNVLAIGRLRSIRPKQMCQLCRAVIGPTIDSQHLHGLSSVA